MGVNTLWGSSHARHHAVDAETTERMERARPVQRLAAAVIARQMLDAGTTSKAADRHDALTERDAQTALRYLTDRSGKNARSRNIWLAALGIDGDDFATRLVALLESDEPFNPRNYGYWTGDNAFAARRRWAAMKGLPPPAPSTSGRPTPETVRAAYRTTPFRAADLGFTEKHRDAVRSILHRDADAGRITRVSEGVYIAPASLVGAA